MRKFVTESGNYATALEPGDAITRQQVPASEFTFAATPYSQISGDPSVEIATLDITIQEQSSVKFEASTTFIGSVAKGRAFIQAADSGHVPFNPAVIAQSSFDTTDATVHTLTAIGTTGPLAAGTYTFTLIIDVNGDAGSRVDDSGPTYFGATEIFAPP